jgi:hypothetical protein
LDFGCLRLTILVGVSRMKKSAPRCKLCARSLNLFVSG